MADSTQSSPSLRPDWRDRILDKRGRIKDEQTRADYKDILSKTKTAIGEAKYRRQIEVEADKRGATLSEGEVQEESRRRATVEAEQCVDSMDWEKHQAVRNDPDPNVPGRIRIEDDFARDPTWNEVSRNEMDRTAQQNGCFPALKTNDVNYVALGDKDKSFKSDQTHDHFALPRPKQGDPGFEQERIDRDRSDYRVSYKLNHEEAAKGPQFALRDDCSGGTWTVKDENGNERTFHHEGGGQQGVIIQGGEHFKADREKEGLRAYNRDTGKDEVVKDASQSKERDKHQERSQEETATGKGSPETEPAKAEDKAEPKHPDRAEPKVEDTSEKKTQHQLDREERYRAAGKESGKESGKDEASGASKGRSDPDKEQQSKE